MKALITDIQHFSIHDGPGIRTTVFLKGCPLNCPWCHNPECISFENEELFYPERCIGCGRCAEGCFAGARVAAAREMTVEEVLADVLLDLPYYGKEGGVTVSGGEPLAHREFTLALLRACKEKGLHTGIETTLYRYDEEIFGLADLIMTDIKHPDPEEHKRLTGMSNEEMLKNLSRLSELGKPIIVRTPVVTGVNDSTEVIGRISDIVKSLRSVVKYELLPYHPLGVSKSRALGREQREYPIPTKEKLELLKKYAEL